MMMATMTIMITVMAITRTTTIMIIVRFSELDIEGCGEELAEKLVETLVESEGESDKVDEIAVVGSSTKIMIIICPTRNIFL